MAVVAATLKSGTMRFTGQQIEQWFAPSASATEITMLAGPRGTDALLQDGTARGSRRLLSVSVKYSGAASTTITVTHNFSAAKGAPGSGYDVLLNSRLLAGETDYLYQPDADYYLDIGDTITVVAPLLAASTALVCVTLEAL